MRPRAICVATSHSAPCASDAQLSHCRAVPTGASRTRVPPPCCRHTRRTSRVMHTSRARSIAKYTPSRTRLRSRAGSCSAASNARTLPRLQADMSGAYAARIRGYSSRNAAVGCCACKRRTGIKYTRMRSTCALALRGVSASARDNSASARA